MYTHTIQAFHNPVKPAPKKRPAPRIKFIQGQPYYRTTLMTQRHAQAFARCLARNNAFLFSSVQVVVSQVSQKLSPDDDFCYVEYQPKNPDRLAAMFQAEQLKRIRKAEQQSAVMFFTPAGFEPGLYECRNVDEHGTAPHTLSTVDNSCSCEDFFYLCKATGMICHHLVEAKRREANGLLPTPPSVTADALTAETAAALRARLQKDIERDFA